MKNIFRVLQIYDDHVVTPARFEGLYGFEVDMTTEKYLHLAEEEIKFLITKGKNSLEPSSFVFQLILRRKTDAGVYKTFYYFFSYSKTFLKEVMNKMRGVARPLSGREIAQVLFNAQTLNFNVSVDSKKLSVKAIQFKNEGDINNPPVAHLYESLALDNLDVDKMYAFIGYSIEDNDKPVNLKALFNQEWQGALWIVWDFNDLDYVFQMRLSGLKGDRLKYRELQEIYNSGKLPLLGVSVVFITNLSFYDSEEDIHTVASSLLSVFNLHSIKKVKDAEQWITKTPLLIRDYDYVFLVSPKYATGSFVMGLEKTRVPEEVEVWGKNKYGDYVGTNFFDENNAPHRVIIAPTGSGKSFKMLKELVQRLNIDVAKLLKGKMIDSTSLPAKIRYFEVGGTSGKLLNLLRIRGMNIEYIPAKIEEFKYNLCEVWEKNDIEFSATLANLILVLSGDERGFSSTEKEYYKKFLKRAWEEKETRASAYVETIGSLKDEYPELYNSLKEKGYKDFDTVAKIDTEKYPEFEVLKMPRIIDLITACNEEIQKEGISSATKQVLESLMLKLETLQGIDLFNNWSRVNIKNAEFLYLELEMIKSHPLFPAIVGTFMKKIYDEDVKSGRDRKKLYIIEEAHNYLARGKDSLSGKIFLEMFQVMTRESRKYRVQVTFISQKPKDIPPEVYSNIQVKEFLLPGDDPTGREDTIKEITEVAGKELAQELYNLPKFTSLVVYGGGLFTLKVEPTPEEFKVFDTKLPSTEKIKTDDGFIITRDNVYQEDFEGVGV